MLRLTTYLGFLVLLFVLACSKENTNTQLDLSVQNIEELVLNSYFEVILIQGSENKIMAEGQAKYLKKIDIQAQNGSVEIEIKAKGAWMHPKQNNIKLYVTVSNLKLIRANETCKITCQNTIKSTELGLVFASKLNEADLDLNVETFYYWNNFPCGGKLNLSGTCGFLKIWNFALTQVDASQLQTTMALIENSSKGDCSINVSEHLDYSIKGSGNIYCYGSPKSINVNEISSTGVFQLK